MGLGMQGVLNMPLPDDPAELGIVTWMQVKDRMREASADMRLGLTIDEMMKGVHRLEAAIREAERCDPITTAKLERIAAKPWWVPMWLWDPKIWAERQSVRKKISAS